MSSNSYSRTLAGLSLFSLLAACGGGGTAQPTITSQPQSQSVLTGATAEFAVTAAGSGFTYQWKRNGTAIAGATAATYTTPAVTYQDNGAKYTVDVSNTTAVVTSTAAVLTLTLSADQQAFESLILSPAAGIFHMAWELSLSGPQTTGTDFAYSTANSLSASPLTQGPQSSTQSLPQNMTKSLALPALSPTRVLTGSAILVLPDTQQVSSYSYVASGIKVDSLASDNKTVATSQILSGLTAVPLTGTIGATPTEFANSLNAFLQNPAVLNSGAAYSSGAAYLKYTAKVSGDEYIVFDCAAATTGASVSPCATNTTLANVLTAGESSASDGVTYTLADGTISTVGGVQIWVATQPRPAAVTGGTVEYRTYFAINGNVYTGELRKDGTVLNGNSFASAGTLIYLPYQIRINKATLDSLTAADTL
jgi:hypothetical protein